MRPCLKREREREREKKGRRGEGGEGREDQPSNQEGALRECVGEAKRELRPGAVAHTCNPRSLGGQGRRVA